MRSVARIGNEALVVVSLLAGPLVSACQSAPEESKLAFSAVRADGKVSPLSPMAVGAYLNIDVYYRDQQFAGKSRLATLRSVVVDQPEVFRVEVHGSRLHVVALREGASVIRVESEGGEREDVELRAETPNSFHTEVLLNPSNAETGLFVPIPSALYERGFTLLPDAGFVVGSSPRDQDGQALSGFGAAQWASTSNEVLEIDKRADSESVWVKGAVFGDTELKAVSGFAFRVGVREQSEAATFEYFLYTSRGLEPLARNASGRPSMSVGFYDSAHVAIAALDEGGRIVLGREPLSVEAPCPMVSVTATALSIQVQGANEGTCTISFKGFGRAGAFDVSVLR